MNASIVEIVVFIVYLVCMLGIGIYFFVKEKDGGEKTYFLGGRHVSAWVGALSAGASDMSAWVLMGLPASIYAQGIGKVWIAVGLAIGYTISWLVEAPRLRQFSVVAGDSITIPQYLTNRFKSKSLALQQVCAIVFLIAYTVYAASSVKACGTLFHKVIGIDKNWAMYLAALVIVGYTFLGGFSAVCWTDFFQGMLMLGSMLLAPIFAGIWLESGKVTAQPLPAEYWSVFGDWKAVVNGLTWGLGYFGMPHIIIRFMSLKSQKELRKSAKIGISWTILIVIFAAVIGVIGRKFLGYSEDIEKNGLVFINMVRTIFPSVFSGILLSAVLAASMSTADSQLLAASSSFASDVYKSVLRKGQAAEAELQWMGRMVVLLVAAVALLIATNPDCGTIMDLVENAWGIFGASFGPAILLSLFWRRFNFTGALVGIIVGAVVDNGCFVMKCPIYELLPGFVVGMIAAVIATLATPEPSDEVKKLYDDAVAYND